MLKPVAFTALALTLSIASTASAQQTLSPRRQSMTAIAQRQPIPQRLCPLGELDRVEGDLAAARSHLEEGLRRPIPRSTTALGRKTVLFQCHLSLAQVLLAQSEINDAWTHIENAMVEGETLPASRDAATLSLYLDIARRRWSGEHCVDQWEISNIEAAELATLGVLARGDNPGVRQCLTAIRARATPEHRGVCRAIDAPHGDVAPYTPNSTTWTTIAPQVGAIMGDMAFTVARIEGSTTRYVECFHGMSEYSATFSGVRLGANGLIALVANVEPCGEDLAAGETCPADRVAYVIDPASNAAAGYFSLHVGRGHRAALLARPFGEVAGAQPISLDGNAVRIGTARMSFVNGVLVPAAP